MLDCSHCGGLLQIENRVSEFGDLETYLCPICGRDTSVMVARSWPSLCPIDNRRARVLIRWAGDKPTAKELVALRKFVPDFQNYGIAQVQEVINGKSFWNLGEFDLPIAKGELTQEAHKLGLALALIVMEELLG